MTVDKVATLLTHNIVFNPVIFFKNLETVILITFNYGITHIILFLCVPKRLLFL